MSWAKCSECDETFGGDRAFDRHRINMTGKPGFDVEYDWRCATPAEMEAKGWHQDGRGWWRTQADPAAVLGLRRRAGTAS